MTSVLSELPREELTVGICLSGGGFRASFYALGVLRYLAEANLLGRVASVSAVSGGSITAAALADRADRLAAAHWSLDSFLDEVARPLRTTVTTTNLRNRWVKRSAGARLRGRRHGRGRVLGEVLAEHLFRSRRVCDLPDGPQVILTTTDLATGRAFRIARDFIGSYDFGYVEPTPDSIELGLAVAASAAVPTLFPPTLLPTAGLALRDAPPTLSLVDGGVYDNLGLEWYSGWESGRPTSASQPNFVIVVNAGGLLDRTTRTYGGVRGMWRSRDVQYSQTTKLRVRRFVDDLHNSRLRGLYLGIAHDPRGFVLPDKTPVDAALYDGALNSALVAPLARLRTDLDRFHPDEVDLLAYHGYWSTHVRLGTFHPSLAVGVPSWRDFAGLTAAEVNALRVFLEGGQRRSLRSRKSSVRAAEPGQSR